MAAIEEDITAPETVDPETPGQTSIVTTLYDLIAILNEEVEPWEEDVVTAAVVHLCNTQNLHFLRVPGDCEVVCIR